MDFSKLGPNEKLAVYGAIAAIVGGFIAAVTYFTYGGAWVGIIGGIAMLAIVFMPQLSPNTRLPGSKGSLMIIAGAISGAVLVIVFLINLGFVFRGFGFGDALFVVAVAGGVVMAWAGWQEFQAEGGKLQLGTTSGQASGGTPPPAAPSEPAASEPAASEPAQMEAPAEPAPPPAAPAPTYQAPPPETPAEPMAGDTTGDTTGDTSPEDERQA